MKTKQTRKNIVALSLLVATFLTAIEGTVVSTAMPKIASELQGIEIMNWVFSVYLLTSAVMVPIFGKLSDLFGRKIIFNIGTLIFLLGSGLCGFASSMSELIVFRALQGIGAGAIMPVATTIIGDIFPVAQRAKMLGFISLIWGISGIVGPLVGGFFVDHLTWEWIFFINIPFGLVAMFMLGLSLHEKIEKSKKKIDYIGAFTFSIAVIALLYAFQKGGEEHNWTSPAVMSLFAVFFVFTIVFVLIESKVSEPMIPLQLFKNRNISIVNSVNFITSAVLIGIMVYVPMWVQGVLGEGATQSGLALMPTSITWTIGSFFVGRLIGKRGTRAIIVLSLTILIIVTVSLAVLGQFSPIALLYGISGIAGIGFGIVTAYSTVFVQSSVSGSLRGVSTSSNVFFRTLGQTIGVAILGTYFNTKVTAAISTRQEKDLSLDQLNELINPETAALLSDQSASALREVLVYGIHHIFILLSIFLFVSIVLSLFLPKTKIALEVERGRSEIS